jgi:NADH-quinone oxidoreductase subunit C
VPALDYANKLKAKFGDLVSEPTEFRGEITVKIADAEQIFEVCKFAKHQLGFDFLVDITSIDNYGEDPRWTVLYHLRSMKDNAELRLKTDVSEEKSVLPSVLPVWRTSNWHEREIYDMMGISFRGHPDLRRILMWEGYPHHPLRKDFPLAGKPTDLPGVAFTRVTPMEGGPFVTIAGGNDSIAREPRVRVPDEDMVETNARIEARADTKEARGTASGPGPIGQK